MEQISRVIQQHIRLMRLTLKTLGNLLSGVDQVRAVSLKDPDDGEKGWSVLEVVCHLRDFDEFFYGRAVMMLEQADPILPAYDHEALAVERNYNAQNLEQVFQELAASRGRFVEFFTGLGPEDWVRTGQHPERQYFTMLDALMQVGMHDIAHIEQITRILK